MAKNTGTSGRNQIIYSVFVRSYSQEGTFEAVRRDLGRIRALGADIIWLLPIHPIGEAARKGSLGSPYAIQDYRAVNPEYGTLEDFRRLVDDIHALGMKCILDVVYNHTSPDSWLARHHPEWFYRRADGSFGNRVGDWSDVIDLDYRQPGLWDYQIETLKYWAAMVDGFRCDVAPLVPLDFWCRARAEVEAVRPGCFWLAESVEPHFIQSGRAGGLSVLSDSELYQAFDACYDYDVFPVFQDYLKGRVPLCQYAQAVSQQEVLYPENYIKLRFLENHDQSRAGFILPDPAARTNWTAFLYFQKGITLLYAGQEVSSGHLPSLFERDPVNWSAGPDITPLLQALAQVRRHPLLAHSSYQVQALPQDILYAVHRAEDGQLAGVFSLQGRSSLVPVPLPDGRYTNLIDGAAIEVRGGTLSCEGAPIILEAPLA